MITLILQFLEYLTKHVKIKIATNNFCGITAAVMSKIKALGCDCTITDT